MTPRQLAQRAREALRKAANPRDAAQQRSYFKPWEKVHVYGITTPHLRRIERGLYQLVRKEWRYGDAVAFCELLMADRYIESKGLGLLLLARYRRQFQRELLGNAKRWLERGLCDNWPVTDQLSTQIISSLVDQFPALATAVESA